MFKNFPRRLWLCLIISLISQISNGGSGAVAVDVSWKYKNFPLQIQLYNVTPAKASYISETEIITDLAKAPINEKLSNIKMNSNSSKPAVLVIENKSAQDVYFFAVPHQVDPVTASAGHFFECLCIGKVYKIPKNSIWYRIVRINLNSSFQKASHFKIEHQIIGLSEKEVQESYSDRLYNYK